MSVDLKRTKENEDRYTKETILELVSYFGYMTYSEVADFFPTLDEKTIKSNFFELVNTRLLIKKKTAQGSTYYTTDSQNSKGNGLKKRVKYLKSLDFVRYLLNKEDNNGYLAFDIDCVSSDKFPFVIYIVCNKKLYHIMHCTTDYMVTFGQVLSIEDDEKDKIEKDFQRRQPADAPYIIKEEKNRIIIVDDVSVIDQIHFRKVKYIACRQGNDYLIKTGD